jgi:hypothetical protein
MTSVVAAEDPLLLTATRIALEDVVEGSGELAFYDRRHKLPHYLFKDGSKWMNSAADDSAEYIRSLGAACRERGLAYERFLAKKGDVFFWTADLVHRSHPRNAAGSNQPPVVCDALLRIDDDTVLVPLPSGELADRAVRYDQRLRQLALQAAG